MKTNHYWRAPSYLLKQRDCVAKWQTIESATANQILTHTVVSVLILTHTVVSVLIAMDLRVIHFGKVSQSWIPSIESVAESKPGLILLLYNSVNSEMSISALGSWTTLSSITSKSGIVHYVGEMHFFQLLSVQAIPTNQPHRKPFCSYIRQSIWLIKHAFILYIFTMFWLYP